MLASRRVDKVSVSVIVKNRLDKVQELQMKLEAVFLTPLEGFGFLKVRRDLLSYSVEDQATY
jgi:predicted subunit of tRNA(5-methylaminomethyl-2-thiouridylate) methyltransferase